jgi:hypothetical protein
VHARQLVATAAKGLEEEVRQGFRLSIGRGFAGRVASSRSPVVLDEVTSADVVNPILLEKGIRSLLGVPMIHSGELLGVLHVGTLTPRHFTDEDIRLLQLVADRVGQGWPDPGPAGWTNKPPWRCNAACCPPACHECPASRWRPATSPVTISASVATGTTSSSCRRTGWAW